MTTPAEKDAMVLAVLDVFASDQYLQICCGQAQGGGMDENGNGEPPSCCGQPIGGAEIGEARAHLAARVAEDADEIFRLNTRLVEETNRADRAEADLAAVLAFLRDDAAAISYQSLGQYRKAALDAARGAG